MSYGLLSLEPKDRDGNPIENLEDQAIMEGDRELKAWDAIARYMQSFEDTDGDGIANVPEYYETTHGRKVVEDSRNIIDLVKQPNKFSAMITGLSDLYSDHCACGISDPKDDPQDQSQKRKEKFKINIRLRRNLSL